MGRPWRTRGEVVKRKICIAAGALLAIVVVLLGGGAYVVLHRAPGAFFDSAGVPIHYTDQGVGTPVILVHGYTANADLNWRVPGLVRKLAKHFRVITLDLRGHGLSGKPQDPSKYGVAMVDDVLRLMDHLEIPKAHLVGYSMGGFITLKFAARYPGRLITAMPCGAAWMPPGDPLCTLALEIHRGLVRNDVTLGSLHRFALKAVMDLEAMGHVAAGFPELAITEAELRAIPVPMMAVKGGDEELVLGGGDLKAVLPGYEETLIPGGRHSTVIFYRGFHEAILKFLLAHTPATS